ncbi:hypothetical protein [Salegentibacter chungangensis]|uniref:Lipocalin-like domain-containing protein n=1 Tax=Salegentibacter chungangensis TaxID=1335724 RepID=A0ABW3NR28_9FLAO
MKKLFTCFLFVFLIASCSVQTTPIDDQGDKDLTGKWKLIRSSGGIAGTTTEYGAGDDVIIIEFTSNKFLKSRNGEKIQEGSYKIEQGNSIRTTEEVPLIIYNSELKQSFEFSDGRLILFDECYDCFQNEYVKL